MEKRLEVDKSLATRPLNIKVEKKLSKRLRILQAIIGIFNTRLSDGASNPHTYDGSPEIEISSSIRRKGNVKEEIISGLHTYTFTKNPAAHIKHRIIYFAGGGWRNVASNHHHKFLLKLVQDLPETTAITLASPGLAPANPAPRSYPVVLEFCQTICTDAKSRGEIITLMGDSAGGNLALSLALEMLRNDPSTNVPAALVLLSPAVDLGHSNPILPKIEKKDPLLRVAYSQKLANDWAGDWNVADDSRISPIRAENLDQLAKRNILVYGAVGSYDILTPDAIALAEDMAGKDIRGQWLYYEACMHCWLLMAGYGKFSIEVKIGFEWLVAVLNEIESGIAGQEKDSSIEF